MLIIPVNHEALRLPPHRLDCVSFFVAPHGPLSSLFQPLGVPSWTPFPTFGGFLSGLLQPLRGPSLFFVALRGYLFAFSWKFFLRLAILGRPLSSLLQPLSGPSSSLSGPSWITLFPCVPFVNFFLGLGGAAKRRQHFAVGVSRSQAIGGWSLARTFPTITQSWQIVSPAQ